jgi:hypothetical protein
VATRKEQVDDGTMEGTVCFHSAVAVHVISTKIEGSKKRTNKKPYFLYYYLLLGID